MSVSLHGERLRLVSILKVASGIRIQSAIRGRCDQSRVDAAEPIQHFRRAPSHHRDPLLYPTRNPIGWTDATWNPWAGCTKLGLECQRCYALIEANMKAANPKTPWYQGTVDVNAAGVMKWAGVINQASDAMWSMPLREKRPSLIFTCSMSDFFHTNAHDEWRLRAFDIMRTTAGRHIYQILTKRPEEAEAFLDRNPSFVWPANAWMGVSVGVRAAYGRIEILRRLPAAVKFLSVEPLLEPMPDLPLDGIDWVIVGGES